MERARHRSGTRDATLPRLARLRTVLAGLAPASIARARWRRPEDPVEPRVRRLVAERLAVDGDEIGREVSLTDDLAADSLDLVELAIDLEAELGITLPEPAIDELRTYGQLVDVVETRARERRAREAWTESERRAMWVWARIVPGQRGPEGRFEQVGWLTPYTAETIIDSALRAGRGARLEMSVPPDIGGHALSRLRAEFTWLRRREIAVSIRRDPALPSAGQAM
jgi:acyl carrier protein